MVMEAGAQNTYYYRPSPSRYRAAAHPAAQKKSVSSINSIDDDDWFKPDYNTLIKPYNPFSNNGWAASRPAAAQPQPQYKWKLDSIESDESDEHYRRPRTRPAEAAASKPVSHYYHSDSSESDEVYRRASKPVARNNNNKAATYYQRHSDESDEEIYRRFLAPYRKF